jgi:hypothetical protein
MSSPGSWSSSGDIAPAATRSAYELRPLSTGEVLDRTFQLYRSRFTLFAGLAALPAAFGTIIAAGRIGYLHHQGTHGPPGAIFSRAQIVGNGIYLLSLLLSVVPYGFIHAAISWAVSALYLGEQASIKTALAAAWPRWLRYVYVVLLQIWIAAWMPLVFAVAAISVLIPLHSSLTGKLVAGLLFSLAGLSLFYSIWAALRVSLSIPASVVESLGPLASIRRSKKLLVDRKFRIFLLGLLLYALYLVLGMMQLPLVLLLVRARGMEAFVTQAIILAISFLAGMLIAPVSSIGLTLFYFDERVRREGFDIEWMMQKLPFESSPSFPAYPEPPGPSAAF